MISNKIASNLIKTILGENDRAWVGLLTAAPTMNKGSDYPTTTKEVIKKSTVSNFWYERVEIEIDDLIIESDGGTATMINGKNIIFNEVVNNSTIGSGDDRTIKYVGIFDRQSGGNLLAWVEMGDNVSISSGVLMLRKGALQIKIV